MMRYLPAFWIALSWVAFGLSGCSSDQTSPSGESNGGGATTCERGQRQQGNRCVPEGNEGDGGFEPSIDGDDRTDGTTGGDGGTEPDVCGPQTSYVQIYRPNIFLLLDTSESMEGSKIQQAKQGLNTVANQTADAVRWGVARFPKSGQCAAENLLEMGEHSSSTLRGAWQTLDVQGGTPTGTALYQTRFKPPRGTNWLTDPDDPDDGKRSKAVILVTDGKPNDKEVCQQTVRDPVEQASKIASASDRFTGRVRVYVIGFRSNAQPSTLNAIARAGGTDAPGSNRFYTAGNANELASAIQSITSRSGVCTRPLSSPPPEGSSVTVELDDMTVPRSTSNGFTYDADRQAVLIRGSWCDRLKSRSRSGETLLEITIGCPDCRVPGESCQSDDQCCKGTCEQGTCVERCRQARAECTEDGDCCSGTCTQANPVGECVER